MIFPGVEGLYPCSNREGKICRSMTTSSIEHRIGWFHVVVVHWTSKKCTKERDARAELLPFAHKTNCFLTLLSSSSSLLKVPNVVAGKLPDVSNFIIFRSGEGLNAFN